MDFNSKNIRGIIVVGIALWAVLFTFFYVLAPQFDKYKQSRAHKQQLEKVLDGRKDLVWAYSKISDQYYLMKSSISKLYDTSPYKNSNGVGKMIRAAADSCQVDCLVEDPEIDYASRRKKELKYSIRFVGSFEKCHQALKRVILSPLAKSAGALRITKNKESVAFDVDVTFSLKGGRNG